MRTICRPYILEWARIPDSLEEKHWDSDRVTFWTNATVKCKTRIWICVHDGMGNVGLQSINFSSALCRRLILHTAWSGLSGLMPSQHLWSNKHTASSHGSTSSLWKVCLGADTPCTVSLGKLDCVYAPTGWLRACVGVGPVGAEASETCDFWGRLRIRTAKHGVSRDHAESL